MEKEMKGDSKAYIERGDEIEKSPFFSKMGHDLAIEHAQEILDGKKGTPQLRDVMDQLATLAEVIMHAKDVGSEFDKAAALIYLGGLFAFVALTHTVDGAQGMEDGQTVN